MSAESDLDPARVDVLHGRTVAPVDVELERGKAAALKRAKSRNPSPGIIVEPKPSGNTYTAPHDDLATWELQLADAFGTRSMSASKTFTRQLVELCDEEYDYAAEAWKPNEAQLNAALSIVAATRPRDELEAALAAQMVAIHLMQMKVASAALRSPSDVRMVATAGKLARTYTMQLDAMRRAKGRNPSTHQKITVKHEKHIHNHQHVHFAGGGSENDRQPHTAGRKTACGNIGSFSDQTGELTGSAALPGPDEIRQVVPLRRGKG